MLRNDASGRCRLPRPYALNQEIEGIESSVSNQPRASVSCLARDRANRPIALLSDCTLEDDCW